MGLSTELTGKIYPSATYGVTAEAIRAYAAATNEDNPAFAGERPVAPPAFPIVAASGALWAAMADEELGANLARLVHFGEDHLLHAPIRAGDVLSVESSLENVEAGEAGETFTLASRLTNQDGILAAEVRSLMLIRGSGRRRPRAEAQQGPPEVLFEVAQRVDEDQAFRYAEASGDRNAVHLDEEAARAAGFPGIILHGMCTMALAGKAVL
ncbi:MAG: FAS1-like dehydratase domain-containing protein, partial [Candidatus Methylomirabilales bacterium]